MDNSKYWETPEFQEMLWTARYDPDESRLVGGAKTRKSLTLMGVLERGWSRTTVAKILGAPDQLRPNPHHRSDPKKAMRLYFESRVLDAEKGDGWRKRVTRPRQKTASSILVSERYDQRLGWVGNPIKIRYVGDDRLNAWRAIQLEERENGRLIARVLLPEDSIWGPKKGDDAVSDHPRQTSRSWGVHLTGLDTEREYLVREWLDQRNVAPNDVLVVRSSRSEVQ